MRYIGSKARILDFISETVKSTYGDVHNAVVADLFAGTASVADMFKKQNAKVISNDYLNFSYAIQVAKIKLNKEPVCELSYQEALDILNDLQGINGFFYREYTLEGSKNSGFNRNYFSVSNAKKIDDICVHLHEWLQKNLINEDMYYLLAASLVDAITKVSNTSGTYGAFLKIDDQRKNKSILLERMEITDNHQTNTCYCEDIEYVIEQVGGDILYLDPPYNSRQYPPYYHILETAVLYDEPDIYGITGRRPYQEKLSPFCMKEKALPAMVNIVAKAQFQHIYISYSTDGIVPYKQMCDALRPYGDVECFFRHYRRYKSNDGGNIENKLKEILIYVKKR